MPKYPGVRKKRNKWYYRLQYNNKRYEKGSFDTAQEANRSRLEHLDKLQKQDLKLHNLTLRDFIIKYLEEYEKPYNSISTVVKTESICRNHIIPLIGSKKLKDLKTFHLVQFQSTIVKTRTQAVAHNTMRILRKILNKAVEWELIAYNPLKGRIPSPPNTEHSVLTLEQLFHLVEELNGMDKCIVALAGFAAFRRGEIFGLRWEDIDFKKHTINLRRQYSENKLLPMKTEGSRSIIPVWDGLITMLKEWRLKSGSPEWVFRGKEGNPFSPGSWCRVHWEKIKKEFKLPKDLRFHDLRHTFASILLSEGADLGDVQKLLRHSSYRTTADIYRHLMPGQLNRNFRIFTKLCGEQSGER